MIDRNHFTEQAWNAIALSTQAANDLGHNYVGTEHLLVGLLLEEEGVASRVLEANGVNADKVKELISQLIFPNQNVGTIGETVYTPGAVRVRNQSYREAVRFKAPLIGTEHLLIAMIRESDCAAVRLLNTMDVACRNCTWICAVPWARTEQMRGRSFSPPDPEQMAVRRLRR